MFATYILLEMNKKIIKNWMDNHHPAGIAKLAGQAEVSTQTIINILSHGREPRLQTLKRLAAIMGVSLDELCSGDDDNDPSAA